MYSIGIDVGGTNLKAGLIDTEHELVSIQKTPLIWESQEKLVEDLLALADSLIAKNGINHSQISHIGIGFPGPVDNKKGMVIQTVNIPIKNMPITHLIQKRWDVPICLGNDADCAALGEYYHYKDNGIGSLILVTLGTGIGTGLIFNGRVWSGHNGCGGEGGHISIVHDGEQCTCGRKGCWERYASASALIRQTQIAMEADRTSAMWRLSGGSMDKVDGRTAFEAMRAGDFAGKTVVDQYICYLADGLITLINLLQPDIICLGGGISNERAEDLLYPLRERIMKHCFDRNMNIPHTQIMTAKLGNDAGMFGAALLRE